jgi:Xaa-Pro aminopeptidase
MVMEIEKVKAIKEVLCAAENAMSAAEDYLKSTKSPQVRTLISIIEDVLAMYSCKNTEGVIVASGLCSAHPHESSIGYLEKEAPIVVDIFPQSLKTKYFADITRTFCIGDPPPELEKMYNTVKKAQDIAKHEVRANIKASSLHNLVKDFFEQEGYITSGKGNLFRFKEGFVHSLGHGVTQCIHDYPRIGSESTDTLAVGDVVTIEPGLYYSHIGGVRIEDMILVTEDGFENLSSYPYRLKVG